jgi:hypothetical protein
MMDLDEGLGVARLEVEHQHAVVERRVVALERPEVGSPGAHTYPFNDERST